jgi:hypothetical protein
VSKSETNQRMTLAPYLIANFRVIEK